MTPKRKRIIIYIVIGFILIGFFLIAFNLLKGKFEKDVEKIDKEIESEDFFQKETEVFNKNLEESETEYVENFHYYDKVPRELMEFKNLSSNYSQVKRVYDDEDKVSQQKKFLGNLYDLLNPILDEIEINSKDIFNSLPYPENRDLPDKDYLYIEDPDVSRLHGTNTYKDIIENIDKNYNYSLSYSCSIIDYFDDTTIICMPGYRDRLVEKILFVIDTKERLYDLSFEWEKIRIGDIWWGSKLIKGSYLIKKVGNIYVVYSKD